jgi:biotin-(acetyl-CoA carboxylase) ligase
LESDEVDWKTSYDQRIFGKGNKHTFMTNDQTFDATVKGITGDGRIILETEDGAQEKFGTHEVKWMVGV